MHKKDSISISQRCAFTLWEKKFAVVVAPFCHWGSCGSERVTPSCDVTQYDITYSKMAPTPGVNGVAKEHAAAVTRNYISQPRLSELLSMP